MGTLVEIVAYTACSESAALTFMHEGMAEFERLEGMLSRFDPASELARINREAADHPVRVSAECAAIIAQGLKYGALSAGCFSIALAPLVQLWERCAADGRLPSETEVETARALADDQLIEVDSAANTIRFARRGVALDLGGLAKGDAVDRALEVLRARGLSHALVNAGASSLAGFGPEDAEGWLIGVRHPASEDQVLGTLRLRDAALSSSGGYERPLVIAGRRYNHILDPRCGAPAKGALGATVVSDSAIRAEVMSKMLLLLGCEAALARFDELGWTAEGLLLTETEDGQIALQRSAGLTDFQLR